jgi:ELWxxDGT repeat protein
MVEQCEPRMLLAATLVADLYTAPASSDPKQIIDVDGTALFSADSPGTGAELWKSDGTAAGTVLVKDVTPGTFGSAPASFVDLGGTVLFTAHPGSGRVRQLWRTDGTAAGTVRVTDAVDVDAEYTIQQGQRDLVAHNGAVYFRGIGADGGGSELWRSDGTAAGTRRVKDIRPGPEGSFPVPVISSGGRLYFGANDGVHGAELWVTDGTEAGTHMLKDIGRLEQFPNAEAYAFAAVGGRLLFATSDPYVVGQPDLMSSIWSSDGTEQGTVRLLTVPSRRVQFAPLGDKVVIFFESRNEQQVLLSDGTAAGTVELKNFDAYFGMFDRPIAGDGVVYFLRFDYTDPNDRFNELWKTDGTAAGTVRIDTLPPPPSGAQLKVVAGDRLFFTLTENEHGRELWSTDGSPGGARLVKDIAPGPDWSDPQEFADVGGVAFFSADDGRTGRELWRSDGTEAGTSLVKDINLATLGSNPHHLVDANGTLYAATDQNDWQTQLVRTNATGDGVVPAGAPIPNRYSEWVESVTASGDLVYSITYYWPATGEWRLYRTDGTSEGTIRLGAFEPAEALVDLDHNGTVLFGGNGELWRSDRTREGTVQVKDIAPSYGSYAAPFASLNGVVLLQANDEVHGPELWRSDGTAAGTVLLKDIVPGPAGSSPRPVGVVAGVAYFRVYPAPGVVELWKSDGTEAGTARVAAVGDGPYQIGYPLRPEAPIGAALGDRLIFSAYNAQRRLELWSSDGTEGGTVRIDPNPGTLEPRSFVAYGDRVYFSGYDPEAGRELWSTTGTAAGTQRVADVWPGAVGSDPNWLTASGGALWFGADSPLHGRELWKFIPDQPTVVARQVFYNNSTFDGGDPAGGAADLAAVAPDQEALRSLFGNASPLSAAYLTSFDKGINGLLIQLAGGSTAPQLGPDDLQFRVGTGGNYLGWAPAPAPAAVTPLPGHGQPTFLVTWPDGAIKNTWLRVGIRANEHTGLAAPDFFFVGNLVGDADGNGRVNALDLAATRRLMNSDATTATAADFNRDGRVNALDLAVVRRNTNQSLTAPTPPGPPAGPSGIPTPAAATDLLDDRPGDK